MLIPQYNRKYKLKTNGAKTNGAIVRCRERRHMGKYADVSIEYLSGRFAGIFDVVSVEILMPYVECIMGEKT
jgi:hypothetical protein